MMESFAKLMIDMEERRQRERLAEENRRCEEDRRRAEEAEERRAEERRVEENRRAEEAEERRALLEALTNIVVGRPMESGLQDVRQQQRQNNSVVRTAASHPPPVLSLELTVGAFRRWRSEWEDYATLVHLDDFPEVEKLVVFRRALHQDVQDVLDHLNVHSRDSTDDITINDRLDALAAYFQDKRDLGREREAFERRVQKPGEPFDHFLCCETWEKMPTCVSIASINELRIGFQ